MNGIHAVLLFAVLGAFWLADGIRQSKHDAKLIQCQDTVRARADESMLPVEAPQPETWQSYRDAHRRGQL